MLELTITNEQKVRVSLKPQTERGRPAPVDGKPAWSVSSGDATLEVSDDGLSADVISPDAPGESMIVVEADADLGQGVQTVSDAIRLIVEGARAISLGLTSETPVPK